MKVIAVIPARHGSRRFPGKALHPVRGVPLVARVAAAVRRARLGGVTIAQVIVATDDARIAAAVTPLRGVEVVVDHAPYRSGSDRVAAVVSARCRPALAPSDVVINVQADEPLIDGDVLRAALAALGPERSQIAIGTVAVPIRDQRDLDDRDLVKVAFDAAGRATSFTRDRPPQLADGERAPLGWAHAGVYAFRHHALQRFAALPTSPSESREDLEQLRALSHGMAIGVGPLPAAQLPAINRLQDVARVEALLASLAAPGQEMIALEEEP